MQHEFFKSYSLFKANIGLIFKSWSITFSIYLVSTSFLFILISTQLILATDAFNIFSYSLSYLIDISPLNGNYSMPFEKANEEAGKYLSQDYKINSALLNSLSDQKNTIYLILMGSLVGSIFITFLITKYFIKIFESVNGSDFIRGATIILDKQMLQLIKKRKEMSDYLIDILPIPISKVKRHIGLFGDTGVGKSVTIMQLLDVIRAKNESAFIVDKSGEFIQHYYNPETDIILSPFDDRSKGWMPFYEAEEVQDFERLARSFIPTAESSGQNDHWPEASVTVLTWLMYQLSKEIEKPNVDDIISVLTTQDKKVNENLLGQHEIVKTRKLNELLEGTLAELLIDPESPEHTNSVIASITPKVRALYYLRGLENREPFSITNWVQDEDRKGWVFIRVSEDQLDSVNTIITTWIDTFIKAIISLPKSQTRVIHGVIDELQSFDKINTLSKAVFEGRKHGLRLMIGFTSVMELIAKYGEHSIKAILSMLNTKVIFLTSEPDAAEWCAKVLGEEDVKLNNETISTGTNDNISLGDNRTKQHVVMPSEIQLLPDLQAYVKFSGDWPVTKIKTTWKDRPIIAEHFVKRKLENPTIKKSIPVVEEVEEANSDFYDNIDFDDIEESAEEPIL